MERRGLVEAHFISAGYPVVNEAGPSFFLVGRIIFLAGFAASEPERGAKVHDGHESRSPSCARRAGYNVTNFTGG